ncbi:pentapeptide repeat-containing protein [Nonomuraea guangzhouensis]|uniref:Pentapeptide repeat-containing protein n=1 Tax=Nonomuraea guangzhouensis TaxID=1291555 RepID=A0ABW4GTL8_9ACTN|nr:pentapeptide repeat-containing protein [Nonomuraea guangzhouensis]
MNHQRRWPRRLSIVIVAIFTLMVVLLFLPAYFAPNNAFNNTAEAIRAQHEARGLLLQGLAGLAVVIGAYAAWRQFHVSREQLQLNLRATAEQLQAARDQLVIAQQAQITERFTRAVDQLGSDQLVVRIGGIHALARIAKDSPGDSGVIAEILCSYVRQHAPTSTDGEPLGTIAAKTEMPHLVKRIPDVQAVLTVLSQRRIQLDEHEPLRLMDADLRRANLARAHLIGADLEGSQLNGAWMPEARLDNADLTRTDLRGANLAGAKLNGADLTDAVLCDAHLEGASLRDVNLRGARLDGVVANQATIWPEGFVPQERNVAIGAGHDVEGWSSDH